MAGMSLSLHIASALFLTMGIQLVLGAGDKVIAEESLRTARDCWQEIESILLNSSHNYNACMY